mmetsp:Transcript_38940/g.100827  ORF Transcript_38940/g.100827 Transcript_38940/m.100827 type:complete len:281 (-) Transcript_38940:1142-1984(-)
MATRGRPFIDCPDWIRVRCPEEVLCMAKCGFTMACEKNIQHGIGIFEPRHHHRARSHGQGHHRSLFRCSGNALRHSHHERFLVHREVRSVLHLRGSRASTKDRDICAASLGDGNVHVVGELGHELATVRLAGLGQTAEDGHRVGCNDTAGASQVVVAAHVEFPQLPAHVRGCIAAEPSNAMVFTPMRKGKTPVFFSSRTDFVASSAESAACPGLAALCMYSSSWQYGGSQTLFAASNRPWRSIILSCRPTISSIFAPCKKFKFQGVKYALPSEPPIPGIS